MKNHRRLFASAILLAIPGTATVTPAAVTHAIVSSVGAGNTPGVDVAYAADASSTDLLHGLSGSYSGWQRTDIFSPTNLNNGTHGPTAVGPIRMPLPLPRTAAQPPPTSSAPARAGGMPSIPSFPLPPGGIAPSISKPTRSGPVPWAEPPLIWPTPSAMTSIRWQISTVAGHRKSPSRIRMVALSLMALMRSALSSWISRQVLNQTQAVAAPPSARSMSLARPSFLSLVQP